MKFSLLIVFLYYNNLLFSQPKPDFDSTLSGWNSTGNAFYSQPVKGNAIPTLRVRPAMADSIGGDYWRGISHPIGHHGDYWISSLGAYTKDTSLSRGDSLTGTLTSEEFNIQTDRIYFLIGGTGGRVELLIKNADSSIDVKYIEPDRIEILSRKYFDTKDCINKVAMIRIVDDRTDAHINVDDFLIGTDTVINKDTMNYKFRTIFTDNNSDYQNLCYLKNRDTILPIWGFVDTHGHWMNNLGFGVDLIYGKPYGKLDTALRSCKDAHSTFLNFFSRINECCGDVFGKKAAFLKLLHEGKLSGYPDFEGWPNFRDLIHQSMYIEWVRRAYMGGLRLIVCPMGNNINFAKLFDSDFEDNSDTTTVKREVEYLNKMMEDLKSKNWVAIAESSEEAKRLILENKLVVVKGMEVDLPGGFLYLDSTKTQENNAKILKFVDYIYDTLKIRQMFPLHHCDNAFGGFSIYGTEFFSINNFQLRKKIKEITNKEKYVEVDSSSQVSFRLGSEKQISFTGILGNLPLEGLFDEPYRPPGSDKDIFNGYSNYTEEFLGKGHINKKGLTPAGRELLRLMRKKGMIIDIDHMSMKSTEGTLIWLDSLSRKEGTEQYPVLAGHTNFLGQQLDLSQTSDCPNCLLKLKSDHAKTDSMVARIKKIGGFMSPITEGDKDVISNRFLCDESPGSSKSWAEAYLYALHHLESKNVGLGTDMNGFVTQISPRFGTFSSYSLRDDIKRMEQLRSRKYLASIQKNGIKYETDLQNCKKEKFEGKGVYSSFEAGIWQAIYSAHSSSRTELCCEDQEMKYGFKSGIDSIPIKKINFDSELKFAAYRVAMKYEHNIEIYRDKFPADLDVEEINRFIEEIDPIYHSYRNTLGKNTPLKRSMMKTSKGIIDFDFNIDGLAHYGLFPDFMQDLINIGITYDELSVLFHSAGDFTEMMSKCERISQKAGKE